MDFIAAAVFHWLHYIAWSIKVIASLLKGTVSIILLSKINKDDVLSRAGKVIEHFLLEIENCMQFPNAAVFTVEM